MKHHPYIRPAGRPIRTPWWQRVAAALATLAFVTLGAVALVEWAVGCGETYTDSKGMTHANECVLIPNRGDTDAK
jgi:hypothetical protein